jgi:hypothetical protein
MDPHIFLAVLVHGEVDRPKRPPADLLLDKILVDAVLGGAVILAVAVLGPRIECFLCRASGSGVLTGSGGGAHLYSSGRGCCPLVVSQRGVVGGERSEARNERCGGVATRAGSERTCISQAAAARRGP